MRTISEHDLVVHALQQVGDVLVSASSDRTLKVWDADTWECERTLRGHTDSVYCLAEFDGKVLSGAMDKTIKLWDPRTGACERTLEAPGYVCSLCVVGDKIASGLYGGEILVWSTATWELERTLEGHVSCVNVLLQVGDVLVVASSKSLKLHGP